MPIIIISGTMIVISINVIISMFQVAMYIVYPLKHEYVNVVLPVLHVYHC